MGTKVLVTEGRMIPVGDMVMIPLDWKLRLQPSHFELLMSLDQQAKKAL